MSSMVTRIVISISYLHGTDDVNVLYHMRILYRTRMVRFSVPYAYGIDIRVWYVPYAYYAFSQCLLALQSPSYNGLSLQAFLAE